MISMSPRFFGWVRQGAPGAGRMGAVACLTAACWVTQAHAGLFDDDEARQAILDLRHEVQDLKDANAAQSQRLDRMNQSVLDLNAQIEQLRQDVAKQRGDSEVTARTLSDLQRQQKDLKSGVDERVAKLEPQQVSIDGQNFTAQPNEIKDYQAAMDLMRQSNFDGATTALQTFLQKYPTSGYKPSALYWLGNAQYGTSSYKEAMASFRALLDAYPDHVRAPEALLSVANCQIELKDTKAARHTLGQLIKTYPKSEAAEAGRERLAKLKK